MSLSNREKRALVRAVEPLVKVLYATYRSVTKRSASRGAQDQEEKWLPSSPRKVLVVRLDAIGDLLLSEPAIAAIKASFPNARVDVVASRRSGEVLIGNPNVDRLIHYRAPWHASWRGERVNWTKAAKELWQVLKRLREERYDLALELRGDFRDILFTAAVGARVVCGTGFRGGKVLLDRIAHHDEAGHQVELALAIAAAAGATAKRTSPVLFLTSKEKGSAEELLPEEGVFYIGCHLGAGFPSKCLPLEKFAAVAKSLYSTDASRRIVIVGGPEDRPLADSFQRLAGVPTIDLVGALSVRETAAVLERCHLFIGNDSAPMHLAAAGGVPVVTFFGPSEPWKFHPYGTTYRLLEVDLSCRPCDYVHCIHREYLCMTRQSADAVIAAAEELLSAAKGARTERVATG